MLRHLGHDVFAFRRELIDKVDENTVNDDSFIALKINIKGFKIAFLNTAKVKLMATSDLRDYIIQRIRINYGHKLNKKLTGCHPTTLKNMFLINLFLTLKY